MDALLGSEFLVLAAVLVATLLFVRRSRGRQAPPPLVLAGAVAFFSGLVAASFISLHLAAVLGIALSGRGLAGAPEFTYDFRFVSLVLVGLLVLLPALVLVGAAAGVTRAEAPSWRRAVAASVVLFSINLPLMPIQGFAVGLGAFAAVTAGALALVRARMLPAAVRRPMEAPAGGDAAPIGR